MSLACALVAAPRMLVLDEPTVELDPLLRAELWDRMADAGTTLLVSIHVMEEASHCAFLLPLREGSLLAQLTPLELNLRGASQDLERAFLNIIRNPMLAGGNTGPAAGPAARAEGEGPRP